MAECNGEPVTIRDPRTMGAMSRQPGDLRPGRSDRPDRPPNPLNRDHNWRMFALVLFALIFSAFLISELSRGTSTKPQPFSAFTTAVAQNDVTQATVNNDTGKISYTDNKGVKYTVSGPHPLPDTLAQTLQTK